VAYVEISVLSHHPEFAEEILLAHGAQSVSYLDAADDPVLEPAPGATPLWPRTRTVGLFDDKTDLAPAIAALRATLPDGTAAIITTAMLDEQEWVRLWLRDCVPLKFGERLWVCPREKAVREPGAVTVLLDPGLAFGTGTHPSTALCLDWLARADLAGRSVLDYGCGSGLLAIAALKLGAARATGVDIDPQALIATRENADENGVTDRLTVVDAARFAPEPFDVVVANILANPLVELAPRLAGCVAPGGALVLAGVLDRQADEVMAAYRPWLTFAAPALKDGWARLAGRKPLA